MDAATLVSATIGAVIALGGAIGFLLKVSARLGALEVKVETMWQFQIRRAFAEAVSSGVATMNSPLTFDPKALSLLDPIRSNLMQLWESMGTDTSDAVAMLEIEKNFGERLVRDVCIPCKLTHGACLIMALAVAKGKTTMEFVI